jgi:hypothetical protein
MWKSVRRVTEHKQKTSWFDFAMTEQQISLWKVMLQKSPLTNLALPKRRWPLALHESFLSLEDGDVWRGLCALYLSMGFVTPVAALGQALWSLVGVMPFSEASLSATPPNTRLTKRVAQLFYHLCVLGLYLRGDELLEQIASQLSGGATSASEGQPGGQPEDNGAKLLLLTFATLLDTEQQRSVLRVPNELRPNEQNPNKLTKTLRSMYDLTMKVVPRTEYDRCLSHLMGSL